MIEQKSRQTVENIRFDQILLTLKEIFSKTLETNPDAINIHDHFLEMGLESLYLLQIIGAIKEKFDIDISFRLLFEKCSTIHEMALYLVQQIPLEELAVKIPQDSRNFIETRSLNTQQQNNLKNLTPKSTANTAIERLITQQLQLMSKQLEILRQNKALPETLRHRDRQETDLTEKKQQGTKRQENFNSSALNASLTPPQQQHLDALITRIVQRTQQSKQLTQSDRPYHANSRAVGGFRLSIKEILYPIYTQRGVGARIWDIDGNEYLDMSMGFGALLFGHSPAFVIESLQEHLQQGIQHGPQSRLAGQVAQLICQLTGNERAAFCNSGKDAIEGAIRIARAVTGRSKIAYFKGSFHGNLDDVLFTGVPTEEETLRSIPNAPGIPEYKAQEVLILNYDSPKSIELIKAHAQEIAAVLVEPVQSARPDFQPQEFLHQLRQVTQEMGIVLIFDEVITGFRVHPGGVQALWNIQADLTTYGKAVGGGLPIGVIAGKASLMDALDGGFWRYGDVSFPQAEMTVFAGTFFKHPLVMTAAWATLNHLKQSGPQLQGALTQKTAKLAETLNTFFEQKQLPIRVVHFGSLFSFAYPPTFYWMDLFFYHLLEKGIFALENRRLFLSTAHTDADIEQFIKVVKDSIVQMQAGEFLPSNFDQGTESQKSGVRSQRIPLIEAQKELWFLGQMGEEASRAYNQSMTLHLRGQFHLEAMRQAIREVVNRHEALRTTFNPEGDYQCIHPSLTIDVPLSDFSSLEVSRRDTYLSEFLATEAQNLFDLEKGPLVRFHLIKLAEDYHLLVFTNHHIVVDGWSVDILLRELMEIYDAVCQGISYQLPQPMQISDYAQWQLQQQHSPAMADAKAYWLKQFADSVPVLNLPSDRPRSAIATYKGTRESFVIQTPLYNALKNLSRQSQTTLFTTLLAAFMTLLHRLTGQDDLIVGIPAAGQSFIGAKYLVGHCVNLLPIRSRIEADPTFTEYLSSIQQVLLAAYDHQIYPYIQLVKQLNLARDAGQAPLVTTQFNLDIATSEFESTCLEMTAQTNPTHSAISDLSLDLTQTNSELVMEWEYNTDRFDSSTIHRWMGHFQTLLESFVAYPEQHLSRLPLLTTSEREQILNQWNQTQADYPKHLCIHQLFETQVERSPDAIAVISEARALTYRELNQRANQLAHYLEKVGVGAETLVAICVERSLEMVIGLLGILKAGGAYLPLDPTYPQERLSYILGDANVSLLLTQASLVDHLPEKKIQHISLDIDWPAIAPESSENLLNRCTSENLAYVIYTSGSTGKPKGVTIQHHSLVNFTEAAIAEYELTERDRLLQFASISFDVAAEEIYPSLSCGATLVLRTEAMKASLTDFLEKCRDWQLTVLDLPTAYAQQLIAEMASTHLAFPESIRLVIIGSERSRPDLLNHWQKLSGNPPQLINAYGPTETTVAATTYKVSSETTLQELPIGRPLRNTQVYIFDRHLQPVPIGVRGEVYIGGAGVARGYLNRPELTAEKFIKNPLTRREQGTGNREQGNFSHLLYKTGDLARYLPSGDLAFLGRSDDQVKIRGFRIELGEIETVLGQHPSVEQGIVTVQEDEFGDKRLVAYVIANQPDLVTDAQTSIQNQLRHFLKEILPEYAIPSVFVMLDALPLTPNGKVNRQALPKPEIERGALEEMFVPPRTSTETVLARIWCDVLKQESVGVHDNFFELGGDSILSLQIIHRANQVGLKLAPQQLFQYQTIAELAAVAETAQPTQIEAEQTEVSGIAPLTPIQHWFFEQEFPEPHHWNQAVLLQVPSSLDPVVLEKAIQQLLRHHDALRLRFEGQGTHWQQSHAVPDDIIPLTKVDLSAFSETEQVAQLKAVATQLQTCLNLSQGPLLRVAQFNLGATEPNRLLIAIHHLVVDGISWQILLEDLQTAYQQLSLGQTIHLPPKTTAFKQWAQQLTAYAQSEVLEQELSYWLTQTPTQIARLPVDYPEGENKESSACTVSVGLSAAETQALLQKVPQAYSTQINDVLLTALVQAFTPWTGARSLLVDLEGHGREALFEGVDLSRTVGWFTTVFPILLNLEGIVQPGEALKAIKEQMRQIPKRGISYGLLRYLKDDGEIAAKLRSLPQAEVLFNYLGQVDRVLSGSSLFGLAQESSGPPHSLQGDRSHLLEVNGLVVEGQLQLNWTYSQNVHQRATVEGLAENGLQALRSLIAHCQAPEAGGFTPSDFPLAQLDKDELDTALAMVEF